MTRILLTPKQRDFLQSILLDDIDLNQQWIDDKGVNRRDKAIWVEENRDSRASLQAIGHRRSAAKDLPKRAFVLTDRQHNRLKASVFNWLEYARQDRKGCTDKPTLKAIRQERRMLWSIESLMNGR